MGEEKKEEEKKEEPKEEKKEEEKKEEEKKDEEQLPQEIVLKVDMHCEACARKVAKALKGFEGVEEVSADSKSSKVVVKGKAADPIKVLKRLQKKSGKKVELISPLPKPPQDKKEEEIKEPPKVEEKKDEGPTVVTIVKIRMHCDACAQIIQKRIRKIKGVESVETDLGNDQAIVKGAIDPSKLVEEVYKRTKRQASIVKEEEEKKEEEKKEEEKKEEKKEGEEEEKIKNAPLSPPETPQDYEYYDNIISEAETDPKTPPNYHNFTEPDTSAYAEILTTILGTMDGFKTEIAKVNDELKTMRLDVINLMAITVEQFDHLNQAVESLKKPLG